FVVDGKQYVEPASSCCYIEFSGPAGKHVIYGADIAKDSVISVDGIPLPGLNALFTPDEEHVASIRANDVWVDGIPVLSAGASQPKFSFDSDDRFHAFALRGNQVIRVDGRY